MDDTETAGATEVHVLWFPMRRSSMHRKLVAAPGRGSLGLTEGVEETGTESVREAVDVEI